MDKIIDDKTKTKEKIIEIINEFASKVKKYPDDFGHYDFDEFVDELVQFTIEDIMKSEVNNNDR